MTVVRAEQAWMKNVELHTDEQLEGPRGAWWFTGKVPTDGRCPGVHEQGRITSLPLPDLSICSRDAVLDYFDNSWTLQETLFAGLRGVEAFYRPPDHNLRHPLIFYYGHPAALYVNKLRLAGLVDGPVNAEFERILETGVDEMSWDDLSKNDMLWPSVAEVHAYRATVYRLVRSVLEDTDFASELGRPVTMRDRAWALFLAFEHDRIHLETSSVLIRELPLVLVQPPPAWPEPAPMRRTTTDGLPTPGSVPDVGMASIPGGRVLLGKPPDFPSFGWDNEYGRREVGIGDFEVSRCLVSNGEFHRFVADGGYHQREWWSEIGWNWRSFRNAKWPRFWVPDGPSGTLAYRLRTVFEEIDMPWDWPVCVNYHEAKAYCAWRSLYDGRAYRLPTEAEFRRIRVLPEAGTDGPDGDPVMMASGQEMRAAGVNLNLAHGSETPVDHSPTTSQGVHDSAGNLWQWCEDAANPLEDFAVHRYYEDFSTPCFDGEHQMILGGSFVSTGDEASIWARFHFRPHFLQHSGIRLVVGPPPQAETTGQERYTTRRMLDRYLLMHYADPVETFGRADHPLAIAHGQPGRIADVLLRAAEQRGVTLDRVLDVGCAVGGTCFALARCTAVDTIVGIDRSAVFVEAARSLARGETVEYERVEQGEVRTLLRVRLPSGENKVEFRIADAATLSEGSFDAVVLANLLDRLDCPRDFLRRLSSSERLLRRGGLLLVASPFSWSVEYTDPAHWLGARPGQPSSEAELAQQLSDTFDLVMQSNEPGVLRDHARHFEYLDSYVSVWHKH